MDGGCWNSEPDTVEMTCLLSFRSSGLTAAAGLAPWTNSVSVESASSNSTGEGGVMGVDFNKGVGGPMGVVSDGVVSVVPTGQAEGGTGGGVSTGHAEGGAGGVVSIGHVEGGAVGVVSTVQAEGGTGGVASTGQAEGGTGGVVSIGQGVVESHTGSVGLCSSACQLESGSGGGADVVDTSIGGVAEDADKRDRGGAGIVAAAPGAWWVVVLWSGAVAAGFWLRAARSCSLQA